MNLWNTLFGKALMTFFISMVPVLELRGAIPLWNRLWSASLGCHSDLHCWKSGPSSLYYHLYSENLRLAAPKNQKLDHLVTRLEIRAEKKSDVVQKYAFGGFSFWWPSHFPVPGHGLVPWWPPCWTCA